MFNPDNNLNLDYDNLALQLETSRFRLSNETIELFRKVRKHLKVLQLENKEVLGLGFIGSRTVKNESSDSDLDCLIFYDGSKYDKWTESRPVLDENSGEFEFKEVSLEEPIRHDKDKVFRELRANFSFVNFSFDSEVKYQIANAIDVSPVGIMESIEEFKKLIASKTEYLEGGDKKLPPRAVWQIISPFFLSIGNGVYEARNKILTELEKREDGEEIWKEIIKSISWIERDAETEKRGPLPKYNFYPQSLKEARLFFTTDKVSKRKS